MDIRKDQNIDPNKPSMDKTYVEGATGFNTPIKQGTRVNATSLGATNPYSQSKTMVGKTLSGGFIGNPSDLLPTGNEPVPLGSGTVVGLLGTGGMARVYKIWNEKLEVFRAAKILLPNGQADMKNRFETEAKITAKLHHPNIVEIYNVGDWNGLPYLEMEFIDGESLESLIHKQGKLPDAISSAITILVARALAYAHSQEFLLYGKTYHGVIHRDLKPANIMISKTGDVRLMDFGIARPTETSLHTVEGNIVGTMQYLSPEQMDGVDIDCRTDIYSLGAILYEMLTGTKTFPQDTITNLMKKKIMNDYRKFSDFDFDVSSSLARIAQKCLQINKEDRYANAEILLKELESIHPDLTSENPVKILKIFAADPESVKNIKKKSFKFFLSPKFIIPVASVIIVGLLVSALLLTGPKLFNENKNTQITDAKPSASSTPIQNTTTPATTTPEASNADTGYRPLGGTSTQQPVSKTVNTPINQKTPIHSSTPVSQTPPVVKTTKGSKVPVEITKTVKPPETTTSTNISPLDKIKQKYGSEDLMTIGKTALKNGTASDAITALENIPDGGPDNLMKVLLLFEAYIETGRTRDALFIANSENYNDAQYDYLCGLLYEKLGKSKQSLDFYQSALTKPSIVRNRNDIRNDALFKTAMIWSDQYHSNPNADTRIQALNAWNIVKRNYSSTPDHQRFKRANSELSTIQ